MLQIVDCGSTDARLIYCAPRVPSKAMGRRGTRRAFKRAHPPGSYWLVTVTSANGAVSQHLMDY